MRADWAGCLDSEAHTRAGRRGESLSHNLESFHGSLKGKGPPNLADSFTIPLRSQSPQHFQSERHRMKILNLRQDAKLSSEARQANQQPLVHAPKTCRQPIRKLGLYPDWRSRFLRKRAGYALAPKG
ncbi:hypothetical protein AVEN_270048-1 [Araneus ventricosus]|uniref:Uncharacterized protein n=1 Tax=Araneus ventricosus TaxID=182803 RepID=A0A4Y2UQY4_ARAVE|nr:hypothetical protein AVEN_270048-1 [Araneus ventricosus]